MPINITIASIARRTALITNAMAIDPEGRFISQNVAMIKPLADNIETLSMELQGRASTEHVGAAVEVLLQAIEVYKDFYGEVDPGKEWYPNVLHLGNVIHNTLALSVVRRALEEQLTPEAIADIDALLQPKRLSIFTTDILQDKNGLRRPIPVRPGLQRPTARPRQRAAKRARSSESPSPSR